MANGRRVRVAAAIVLAGAAAPTAAGPPYVTDDPEPTDRGKWEIYGFASGTVFSAAQVGAGGFDINYGAARDLQLSAVVSLAYTHQPGGAVATGLANTELGAKYRFVHQDKDGWRPDVALFPKIELPTASQRFGSGRVGFLVPLWAEKDFGPWSAFGGVGWAYNPGAGNRDYTFGGFALTRQVGTRLSLGGEVYHQSADAVDTRSSTGVGVGASWQFAKKWSLIGSGGPLLEHQATTGRYAFYVALAFHD